jgi:hypothetical protein
MEFTFSQGFEGARVILLKCVPRQACARKLFSFLLVTLLLGSFCVAFVANADFVGSSADGLPGVETQVLDSNLGNFVSDCSLVLDSSDNPHVAFCDYNSTVVKYAWWNGSSWMYQNVTSASHIASVSLALDSKDNPYISYTKTIDENGHTSLFFAKPSGSSWDSEMVDSYNGWFPSIAIDSKDDPHISYYGYVSLTYASLIGGTWKIEVVDEGTMGPPESLVSIGWYSSLKFDSYDNPHISYYDKTNGDLKYASWNGSAWAIQTVDSEQNVGLDTSLALDSNNNPHITYRGDFMESTIGLRYAVWNGSAWNIQTLENQKSERYQVGQSSSLALDSEERPHISYIDSYGDYLRYAFFNGSAWQIYTLDSIVHGGCYTSLALDSEDKVHICHDDYTSHVIKYVTLDPAVLPPPPPLPTPPPEPTPNPAPSSFPSVASPIGTIYTVDSSGRVGSCCSLALDSNGNPHISYKDVSLSDLRYAHWNGSAWSVEIVDAVNWVGWYTSIAVDSGGRPHISYFDNWDNDLKYAVWDGSQWKTHVVDTLGGSLTSIALDPNDNPAISYYESTSDVLKYASWNGSSWDIQVVDPNGGEFTSLAFDSSGRPHISYYDFRSGYVKYASWTGVRWETQLVASAGAAKAVGSQTSLKLDSSGKAHISYYDSTNKDLKYASQSGSTWSLQTVDAIGEVGTDSSLALDSYEHPHISYCDNTNHTLKYAVWNSTDWVIITVDYAGYAVEYTNPRPMGLTSLALDGNNLARISYFDESSYHLKYFVANTSFAKADQPLDQSTNSTSSEDAPADSPSNQSSSVPSEDSPSTSSLGEPNSQSGAPNESDPQEPISSVLIAVIATGVTSGALAATATALFLRKRKR